MPERMTDVEADLFELDASADETTVAVNVTDMLGEEALTSICVWCAARASHTDHHVRGAYYGGPNRTYRLID